MPDSLGIDVSKHTLAVALLTDSESRPRQGEFANSPTGRSDLLQWIGPRLARGFRATMEATSTYHRAVAATLREAGATVFVVNPAAVKYYAKSGLCRTKTDPVDALTLAHFGRERRPTIHPWRPRSAAEAALTELARHRRSLERKRTAARNQSATRETPAILASLKREAEWFRDEIRRTDEDIQALLQAHPELKRDIDLLRTIPGVGRITAVLIRAELGDAERFRTPREVSAYAGLTPESTQSGVSLQAPDKLCRLGSRTLRTGLYMSAVVLFRMKTLFGDFIRRMIEQRRHNKTILVALMRKLLVLAWGVLRSGEPYDPAYRQRAPRNQTPADTTAEDRATINTRGETETGSAGEQPVEGYPREARRKHGAAADRNRLRPPTRTRPTPLPTASHA